VQIRAAIDAMQPYTTVDGLTCKICFELATEPAPPACGHIFCLKCINHALRGSSLPDMLHFIWGYMHAHATEWIRVAFVVHMGWLTMAHSRCCRTGAADGLRTDSLRSPQPMLRRVDQTAVPGMREASRRLGEEEGQA
jgi:hypothetical protein